MLWGPSKLFCGPNFNVLGSPILFARKNLHTLCGPQYNNKSYLYSAVVPNRGKFSPGGKFGCFRGEILVWNWNSFNYQKIIFSNFLMFCSSQEYSFLKLHPLAANNVKSHTSVDIRYVHNKIYCLSTC